MSNVHLESINESFVRLNTDLSILRELSTKFSFRVDGYQFMTRYKAGVWDGYIRPINTKNGYCPKGLVPKVIQYLRDNDYTYSLDEGFDRFKEKINFDYKSLKLPHEPHDYQLSALNLFNTKKRQVILSATGSGKSMSIYMMIHSIFDYMEEDKKILILVPTVGLVTQLLNDFKDYSVNNKWDVDGNVHLIMSGKDKTSNKKVYISTWQSLSVIKENSYFEKFEAIICDECFSGDTKVLTKEGYKEIRNIVENDIIINYNESTGELKEDIVITRHENILKSFNQDMFEIEFDNGYIIKVTGNHRLLTYNRGWVKVIDLNDTDDLVNVNGD